MWKKWACDIMLLTLLITLFYTLYSLVNSLKRLFVKGRICLTEAKQIKEILFIHSPATRRTRLQGRKHFHGNPLLKVLGCAWPQPRHTLEPVWYQSNIKDLDRHIAECTEIHLELLQHEVDGINKIREKVHILTCHVMARTEFSCSYEQGILIAELLIQYQQIRARSTSWHSCISRFFPRRELKVVEGDLEELLKQIIQPRVNYVDGGRSNSHGYDLLGKLLDKMHKKLGSINMKFIVDQCKKSLLAGDEVTTNLITSTLTLLSRNQNWQDLVRAEINDLYLEDPPTFQDLQKFRLVIK